MCSLNSSVVSYEKKNFLKHPFQGAQMCIHQRYIHGQPARKPGHTHAVWQYESGLANVKSFKRGKQMLPYVAPKIKRLATFLHLKNDHLKSASKQNTNSNTSKPFLLLNSDMLYVLF